MEAAVIPVITAVEEGDVRRGEVQAGDVRRGEVQAVSVGANEEGHLGSQAGRGCG